MIKLPALTRSIVVNGIGLILGVYLLIALIGVVKRNNDLQHDITDLQKRIVALESDKSELDYKMRYYQTDAYAEKEARAKLGLQQPGESIIILPKTAQTTIVPTAGEQKVAKLSNIQQWLNFLKGQE